MDNSQKTMGVGLLVLIAVLGYNLFTANQHATDYANWFLPDYFCLYVRLLRLGRSMFRKYWPTEAKLRGSGLANGVGRIRRYRRALCGRGIA